MTTKNKADREFKTRSTIAIPVDVLALPQGYVVTGVTVEGDMLIVSATPDGKDLAGSVSRFEYQDTIAQTVEYREISAIKK